MYESAQFDLEHDGFSRKLYITEGITAGNGKTVNKSSEHYREAAALDLIRNSTGCCGWTACWRGRMSDVLMSYLTAKG